MGKEIKNTYEEGNVGIVEDFGKLIELLLGEKKAYRSGLGIYYFVGGEKFDEIVGCLGSVAFSTTSHGHPVEDDVGVSYFGPIRYNLGKTGLVMLKYYQPVVLTFSRRLDRIESTPPPMVSRCLEIEVYEGGEGKDVVPVMKLTVRIDPGQFSK